MFSKAQWKIFLGCFLIYTSAYVCRLNLSAALPQMMVSLKISDTQGGMFQTVFALTYAAGQFVNGYIVDRISAKRHMATGILIAAAANLTMGFVNSYPVLLALWIVNAVGQSMLWTPIVKLIAVWYHGRARESVSFGLTMTLVIGHLAAWSVSGILSKLLGWHLAFVVPALVALGGFLATLALVQDVPPSPEAVEDSGNGEKKTDVGKKAVPFSQLLASTGLIYLLLMCVTNGFVRDGVLAWAPTILTSVSGSLGDVSSVVTSLIIPILNVCGLFAVRGILKKFRGGFRMATAIITAAALVFTALLYAFGWTQLVVCALLMGMICALMEGLNPIITTLIPMEYDSVGRVAFIAGLCDSFIYIGSSMAGALTGAVGADGGWRTVFLIWCGVLALGAVLALLSVRGGRKIAAENRR